MVFLQEKCCLSMISLWYHLHTSHNLTIYVVNMQQVFGNLSYSTVKDFDVDWCYLICQ